MDVVDFTPTRSSTRTVRRSRSRDEGEPGAVLRLWSEDAFSGVLRSVDDLSSTKVDRFVNPQTGR